MIIELTFTSWGRALPVSNGALTISSTGPAHLSAESVTRVTRVGGHCPKEEHVDSSVVNLTIDR